MFYCYLHIVDDTGDLKAHGPGTVTATGREALDSLSWDLGLALVCAQRFEEAVDVLGQVGSW